MAFPFPLDLRLLFLLDGDGVSDGSGWTDDNESHSKSEKEITPVYPLSCSIGNRDGPAREASGWEVSEENGGEKLSGPANVGKDVVIWA